MHRLYVLLPTEESCRGLVRELRGSGIRKDHLHVVAGAGLGHAPTGLPEAGVWQKTEIAHGIERGVLLGGMAGLVGGLLAAAFPPAGLVLGGEAVLAWTLAGAMFGALVTAVIGTQEHSHRLDTFSRALASGRLLLMVDVPGRHEEEVKCAIRAGHPEAQIRAGAGA